MFKVTRYFFIVFILTTLLPLILLALWSNHQIEKIEEQNTQHMVNMESKHILNSIEQHIKTNEGVILEKLSNINNADPSEYDYQIALPQCKIKYFYTNSIAKIQYSYQIDRNNITGAKSLVEKYSIPLRNKRIKGIEISMPAKLSEIDTKGPIIIEFYYGTQVNKENFIAAIMPKMLHHPKDRMIPPPPEMGNGFASQEEMIRKQNEYRKHRPNPMKRPQALMPPTEPKEINPNLVKPNLKKLEQIGIPKDKNIKYAITQLKDNNGSIIATVLIKTMTRTSFMGRPPVFRNIFNLIILLAGISLSLLVAHFINRNYIMPLTIIADASKEVKKGNLSIEIKTDSKQEEIITTFKNFNRMIKGLKEKEDIRNSYIASLTHDLRTPIIAQERALGLIAKAFKNFNMEEEASLAKSLEKNNHHLLRLVNLILESYQFSEQKIKLNYSNIDINKTIGDCFEKVKPLAEDKNITLINSTKADIKTLYADKVSIDRVLINLIYNAVENIDEGCTITVNATKNDIFFQITVEDNGPGIAPSELEAIFEMYYTGKSLDRKIGSGLGLGVCKKLIQLHKGELTVDSELGKFTKFTIRLP